MGGRWGGDGRWGGVRDIPSNSAPATWVFPCFNKAALSHFKRMPPPSLIHAVSRLTPAPEQTLPQLESGEGGPRLRQLPLLPPHRRVRWLPARRSSPAHCRCLSPPPPNSFKQNKRALFTRTGCSLMERIQLCPTACAWENARPPLQKQETGNVSSERRCFAFSIPLCRVCAHADSENARTACPLYRLNEL